MDCRSIGESKCWWGRLDLEETLLQGEQMAVQVQVLVHLVLFLLDNSLGDCSE